MIPPPGGPPSGHVAFAPVHVAPLHSLCCHEDGRPVAMASYSGKKDNSEILVAQELLKQSGAFLENVTITSDALHTQKTNCLIFELGGDNLSTIKKKQGNYHKYAENLLKNRPVDLIGEGERGHGRFEVRDITLVAMDTEVSPFPQVAQIIK